MWVTVVALVALQAPSGCPVRATIPDHIRPQDCRIASAVASGLERSATFRASVDRINELNGAVFITRGNIIRPDTRRELKGALVHRVGTLGLRRALFIVIRPGDGDDTVITLGHELQHVIEALEAGVTSGAEMDELFWRIGVPVDVGIRETSRAIGVGHIVARELARNKDRHSPGGW